MFEELGASVVNPLYSIYQGFIRVLPGVIGAIIVLLIGYIIAGLISTIVEKVLSKINFDKWVLEKTQVKKIVGDIKLAKFITLATKWYVFIMFLPPAAGLVMLHPLASLLNAVALWVPQVILAIVVALIGFLVAGYVSQMIIETKTKGARFIADISKFVILVIFALVVLEQIGIKVTLVQNAVLVILAGVVLAFSIGLGLAFGLGGRDEAKVLIASLKKKI